MMKNQPIPSESVTYFFTRSKDVFEENGTLFITLFARLAREFTKREGHKIVSKIESVWVDIDELKVEHATEKMRSLPNRIQEYKVSKEVFLSLYQTSADCPKELYYVTPFQS